MTKLAQIVAVEVGVKAESIQAVTEAKRALTADPAALTGLQRTYEPRDTEGERKPDEGNNVQVNAEDVLSRLGHQLTRLFDVTLTKEDADTKARADVVVTGTDGKPLTLLSQVPVAYLLFLEKQAERLEREILSSLPLLPPAVAWEQQRDTVTGLWKSKPVKTASNKKTYHNHVKFAGDEHHAPQVEVYTTDDPVGDWTNIQYSGAIPAPRARVLVERIREFKRAVISAREEANGLTVTDQRAGDKVFGWLLA